MRLPNRLTVKTLLLFGARSGHLFADCSADLFLAMTRRGWNCVWVTRRPAIQQQLHQACFPCEIIGTPQHRSLLQRASAVIFSSQITDVCDDEMTLPEQTKVIFTGHGKSSKASSLKSNYHANVDLMHSSIAFVSRRVTAALAASTYRKTDLSVCYGIPLSKIAVTGHARTDKLFDSRLRRETLTDATRGSKRILYAPTWRKHGKMPQTRIFGFQDYDAAALLRALDDDDISLHIRPHIQDERFNPSFIEEIATLQKASVRVQALPSSAISDINNVLADFDALITDYSSIDDDFMLLDRPIAYAPFDFQEFARVQGFIEDYGATRAGPIATSFADVLTFIRQIASGHDPDRSKRSARFAKVHDFTDGRSTDRAIAAIEDVLS